METLETALRYVRQGTRKDYVQAANFLVGCPVGGWGETRQARGYIREALTLDRAYTIEEFIDAVYVVDFADRYRTAPKILAEWRLQALRDGAESVKETDKLKAVRITAVDFRTVTTLCDGLSVGIPWALLREAAAQEDADLAARYQAILADAEILRDAPQPQPHAGARAMRILEAD